jgi:HrpA-like RNA helicase
MQDLPIYDVLPKLKQTALTSQTLILEAPPGAGKIENKRSFFLISFLSVICTKSTPYNNLFLYYT